MSCATDRPASLARRLVAAALSLGLGACGGGGFGGGTTPTGTRWGTPVEIDAGLLAASSPSLAVDPTTGDAFAVWLQETTGERTALYASQFDGASATWSTAEIIDAGDAAGDAGGPQVVADRSGRAYAVWLQNAGGVRSVWASVYDGTWAAAAPVDTLNVPASSPRIAVGTTGLAIAVWLQADGANQGVFAARYQAGTWGPPVVLDAISEDATSPAVAVAGNGDAFVVWLQPALGSAVARVRASVRESADAAWSPFPDPVDAPPTLTSASAPAVAAGDTGLALVVWRQPNLPDQGQAIWSARLDAGPTPGVSAAVVVSDSPNPAAAPALAMNGAGTAVAVWHETVSGRGDVLGSRFTPSGSTGVWSAPALVDQSDVGSALNPAVAVDDDDHALAIWEETNATLAQSVVASLLPAASSGWGSSEAVEEDNANDASAPSVGLDAAGDGVAVWVQNGSIWANTRR